MADVVAGEKVVRRPVRLEDRRVETFVRQLVFIGVNQIGVAMILEPFSHLKKGVRLEHVIVIEEADPFTLRQCQAVI